MQADVSIRQSTEGDVDGIVALYQAAGEAGGGLARAPDEVSADYVSAFLKRALNGGIALVATDPTGAIIGEIHASPLGPRSFAHVLGDLTIAVHPLWQGQGIGRRIFAALLELVRTQMPHVHRVELVTQESNKRALSMYESLGFEREGKLTNRIRMRDGSLDHDIPMSWRRDR